MKNIIKLFGFFVIGGLVGGLGTLAIICLFGDKSFAEIGEKLLSKRANCASSNSILPGPAGNACSLHPTCPLTKRP